MCRCQWMARGRQSTTRKGVVVRVNDAWSMSYIAMDEICVKGDVNCHCNTKKSGPWPKIEKRLARARWNLDGGDRIGKEVMY